MASRKTTGRDPAAATEGAPGFEQALERLETIVDELEGGELTLEESLARYEEGIKLSRRLTTQLDEAEKRIERLVESPGGEPVTEPHELDLKTPDPSGEGELPF
jgi:exodeoxyribonuclease VII small subunit